MMITTPTRRGDPNELYDEEFTVKSYYPDKTILSARARKTTQFRLGYLRKILVSFLARSGTIGKM